MKKVLMFEEYISEDQDLNEMIDPLTLLFAAGFVGYMYGKDIIKAYKDKKVLNSDASEIRAKIAKLKDQKAKARKNDKKLKAQKIQKDIDKFEEKLKHIKNRIDSNNEVINDFEENTTLRKGLEDEVRDRSKESGVGMGDVRRAATKQSKKI